MVYPFHKAQFVKSEGWRIVKVYEVPQLNPVTDKPNANAGEIKAEVVAYPGRHLTTMALSLLFHNQQDGVEVTTIEEWRQVQWDCADRIIESMKHWGMIREGEDV